MKSFAEFVTEIFDNPSRFNSTYKLKKSGLVGKPDWGVYTFTSNVDGKNLEMVITQYPKQETKFMGTIEEYWHIDFRVDDEIRVNDAEGKEIRIFSTVLAMLREFIKKENPNEIQYSSRSDEKTRVSLYNRLTRVLAKKYGYKIKNTEKRRAGTYYTLSRR